MARTVTSGAISRSAACAACVALTVGVTPAALAVCNIDANGEIVNPFEPGCGDVMLTYTEADNTGNNVALGYPVPIPVASLTPVDGFREYPSLFARHQSLLTLHDEVTGQVVGQTVANRDIWAYVISDANTTTSDGLEEGAALINGGIHAREWQTPEAATALFEALVERKSDGGLGQYLVENFTTVILPVNNVDGFRTTQLYANRSTATRDQPREGRMRRKNLRNPQTLAAIDDDIATIADNFWGVDLNRNSAQGFGLFGRSSLSPTSLVFRSTAPNTEPELAALLSAANLAPSSRLRLFSDTHSFGQVYLAPTTTNARRNAITATLATRMAAASGRPYQFGPDPPNSPGIGTTADHFGFTFEIPSWTLELEPFNGGQDYGGVATHGHSGFILPNGEAARMREDVTRMYLLGLYRQSGPPVALAAQIRDSQNAEIVYDAQWQATSATARAQTVATHRALVPGRNYRLWVAFSKPMRVRDGGGAVVPYRGQTTGAAVGTVTLEIPSLTGQDVTLANGTWLDTPGGAPNGYLRYSDDAFAVDFTVPASLAVSAATPAVLALTVSDLGEMSLDANPTTAVDWGSGHWVRYENVTAVQGDFGGGADCFFRPFVAPQAAATPPANTVTCRAATPPPPPPPPPSGGGGGGGGGGLEFATLLLLGFLFAVTRGQSARSWLRRQKPALSPVPGQRANPRAGRLRSSSWAPPRPRCSG